MSGSEVDDTCGIETFEMVCAKLEEIERGIAVRHGITGTVEEIRTEIIRRIRADELADDDEGVPDWHSEYCTFKDWCEQEPEK